MSRWLLTFGASLGIAVLDVMVLDVSRWLLMFSASLGTAVLVMMVLVVGCGL